MPRFSDDDAGGEYVGYHVPGVWAKVLEEQRDRAAGSVFPYLEDPVLVLTLGGAEYDQLVERAARDAEEWYAAAVKAGQPVTVSRAVLRAVVPKDAPVLTDDRSIHTFVVSPDDIIGG